MSRRAFTESSTLRQALRSRWPQLIITAFLLGALVLVIAAALAGTPVGNRNLSIVGTWIAWWGALILLAVPFLGRAWCGVCPIAAPGDWLQRGAVLEPSGRSLTLGLRWPRALRNMWLQNAMFALVAVVSLVVLTQPRVTGLLLLGLVIAAVGASLVFERRAFCRYLCPVGGFVGLYSQLAPVELRVKDTALCARHKPKTCYAGSAQGAGCPWDVYPGALQKNTYCGLCLECLRTCPYDNVAVNWRPFGADLGTLRGARLDEAFKAFLMLGSAIAYAAVLLGPWERLKSAAYGLGSVEWVMYAAGFLLFVFVVVPGAFLAAVTLGRRVARSVVPTRRLFAQYARAIVPLGLFAWIAFSLSFVLTNLSYVWPVLSDPLGWGWNLLGTAGVRWAPYLSGVISYLEVGVLLVGAAWSAATARRVALQIEPAAGSRGVLVAVLAYCWVATASLLLVLVG